MGCTFSRNGAQIPLSRELISKNEKLLDDIRFMHKHEVNRDMCLKFIRNIVVPSTNYGAFIDDANALDDYQKIDDKIIEMCRELMENIPSPE
jgi:hypothetical protein